ncbi:hypothetical protein ACFXD5_19300 [Streptomyces sp. NPDC059385]|uniref:hypothetical protein n=1 Tax=Streptomyces sp. NPDC059385 TaxID=3346817 RepID=UPI0036A56211
MNSADGRRGTLAAGLLLAAVLTASCSAAESNPLPATPGSSAAPTPPPRPIDANDLLAATLPNGEIEPAGSAGTKVYERDPEWAPQSISDPDCALIMDPYREGTRPTSVLQTFSSKDNVEWTASTKLTAHPSPAAATKEFDRFRQAVQGCRDFHFRNKASGNGSGTRVTLTTVQAPGQGDEAIAFNLTLWLDVSDINPDVKEIRTTRKYTMVRTGSVIADFSLSPSDSVETMQFPSELMTRQVQRLRDLP